MSEARKTLLEHRTALAKNSDAYMFEVTENQIDRLVRTLVNPLKRANYRVTPKRNFELLKKIILLVFKTQDFRPFFHVEGTQLPLCWNRPSDWDKNYIKYEWGHLHSSNQRSISDLRIDDITNLGLYSARCNQHIQSSMDIEELMVYGGILAQRISNVLLNRRILFVSEEWKDLYSQLKQTGKK